MTDALDGYPCTVSIRGTTISNLSFADDLMTEIDVRLRFPNSC